MRLPRRSLPALIGTAQAQAPWPNRPIRLLAENRARWAPLMRAAKVTVE